MQGARFHYSHNSKKSVAERREMHEAEHAVVAGTESLSAPGSDQTEEISSDISAKLAWGVPSRAESRYPASVAVCIAILIYILLPERYTLGPNWLIPFLELSILVPLTVGAPRRVRNEGKIRQALAIVTIAVVNIANIVSLVLLLRMLIFHGKQVSGQELLFSSLAIWITNVVVFALWYWELDRGGPDQRTHPDHRNPDFLFPQMATPGCANSAWTPSFLDYLYVSFTNATAFSPTDVMPLTSTAKMLMLAESTTSLVSITLVAARAVNILS